MSDLPLCPTCDGTGEEMADSASELGIPGGMVAIGPCPAGCVAVQTERGGYLLDTPESEFLHHLDAAKVIEICGTHNNLVRPGNTMCAGSLLAQALAFHPMTVRAERTEMMRIGDDPCDIKVRILGPVVGEPA